MGDPLANYGVGDTAFMVGYPEVATQFIGDPSCIMCSFSNKMSTSTITWSIRDFDVLEFVAKVLGYATSGGKNNKINRVLPVRHPQFRDLWASHIEIRPTVPNRPSRRNAPGGQFSSWKQFRAVVTYESPPYAIKEDAAVTAEYERYTIPDIESHSEFRQRLTGSFRFPSVAPGVYGTGAKQITGGVAIMLTKTKIGINWMQVPDKGLWTPNGWDGATGATATNIEQCVGKINAASFMGRRRGTMLLESWKPEPQTFAADSLVYGQLNNGLPFRCWNVKLNFVYFDPSPTPNPNTDGGDQAAQAFGHNLLPCPINKAWYRVYVDGKNDSIDDWNYQQADFDQIFKMSA